MGLARGLYGWLGLPAETPFDPQARYVTSYLLPPLALASWRALVSLYTLVTLILVYVFNGASEFSFFTVLAYWGVWAYHTVAAIHTLSFWLAYRRWTREGGAQSKEVDMAKTTEEANSAAGHNSPGPRTPMQPQSWLSGTFPRPLQFLHSLLFSTIATYPLIVTVVFWGVLAGNGAFSDTESAWTNISVHAFNLVFSMLDVLVLGREPMLPWSHCFFTVVMLAMYVGVAYITYATQGYYTYDFLNQGEHGTGVVAGTVIGIGVGCIVSYMIGQLAIFLRELVAAKVQRSGQWGSAKPLGVHDDALFVTRRGPGPEGEGGRRKDAGELQHAEGWRQRWPAAAAASTNASVAS